MIKQEFNLNNVIFFIDYTHVDKSLILRYGIVQSIRKEILEQSTRQDLIDIKYGIIWEDWDYNYQVINHYIEKSQRDCYKSCQQFIDYVLINVMSGAKLVKN